MNGINAVQNAHTDLFTEENFNGSFAMLDVPQTFNEELQCLLGRHPYIYTTRTHRANTFTTR